jgi:hypothetical protein
MTRLQHPQSPLGFPQHFLCNFGVINFQFLRREISLLAEQLSASHQKDSAPRRWFITFAYILFSCFKNNGKKRYFYFTQILKKKKQHISNFLRILAETDLFRIFSEKKKRHIPFQILTVKQIVSTFLSSLPKSQYLGLCEFQEWKRAYLHSPHNYPGNSQREMCHGNFSFLQNKASSCFLILLLSKQGPSYFSGP